MVRSWVGGQSTANEAKMLQSSPVTGVNDHITYLWHWQLRAVVLHHCSEQTHTIHQVDIHVHLRKYM